MRNLISVGIKGNEVISGYSEAVLGQNSVSSQTDTVVLPNFIS